MTTLALVALLMALSILCRAVKDTLAHHFSTSIFASRNTAFWNPAESWRNKWKDGVPGKEKFPGASTVFVWATDAWHLFSSLELLSIHIAIAVPLAIVTGIHWLLLLAGIKVLYALVFNIAYSKAFTR